MTLSEFDRLTKEIISPLLEGKDQFVCQRGTYSKDLSSGVRQVVIFDFDVRTGRSFRVIAGLNHKAIYGTLSGAEAGVFAVHYVSKGELSNEPYKFPCYDEATARESLEEVLKQLRSVVVSWLDKFKRTEDVIEAIEESFPFIKGKLLVESGQYGPARSYLEKHLKYLSRQTKTPQVIQGIAETQELMGKTGR